MTGEECYGTWAPAESVWSRWVRPVLFVQLDTLDPKDVPAAAAPPAALLTVLGAARGTAIIVDLPGAQSVTAGLEIMRRGWRPVPLFNGTHGPSPLIDVRPIAQQLIAGADVLSSTTLHADAPPVFLLDADRMKPDPAPGRYDNRWVVLPQDFPSGTFLRSRGIDRVLLLQSGSEPAQDLAHVLLRWKEAGLGMQSVDPVGGAPADLDIRPPSWFRRAGYTVIALLGLRRANVGGFGAVVPQQTAGGG